MCTDKTIFLLPFAGGTSLLYNRWELDNFTFHPIEYSGHGSRFHEPLSSNMDEIAEDVIRKIEAVKSKEYFLFGHSMGGLIAWLIAQRIKDKPKAIFISACEPPDCLNAEAYRKYQNDEALMRYMKEYGRASERQRTSEVFRKIFFPAIQNDFRILSEYVYEPCAVLDVPIIVLYSKEDTRMRYARMDNWKQFGTDVHFEQLSGDHFYLEEEQNRKRILGIMENVMINV